MTDSVPFEAEGVERETLSFEEHLRRYGTLTYRNRGVSMLPMLKQGRDLFTVQAKTEQRCKKYDVVLYRRPPSSYVLHRVIEVRDKDYVILGDNCVTKEVGIPEDAILGVMTQFMHRGITVHVTDWHYILYSRLWVWLAPVRIFFTRILWKLKAWIKKLLKK